MERDELCLPTIPPSTKHEPERTSSSCTHDLARPSASLGVSDPLPGSWSSPAGSCVGDLLPKGQMGSSLLLWVLLLGSTVGNRQGQCLLLPSVLLAGEEVGKASCSPLLCLEVVRRCQGSQMKVEAGWELFSSWHESCYTACEGRSTWGILGSALWRRVSPSCHGAAG